MFRISPNNGFVFLWVFGPALVAPPIHHILWLSRLNFSEMKKFTFSWTGVFAAFSRWTLVQVRPTACWMPSAYVYTGFNAIDLKSEGLTNRKTGSPEQPFRCLDFCMWKLHWKIHLCPLLACWPLNKFSYFNCFHFWVQQRLTLVCFGNYCSS